MRLMGKGFLVVLALMLTAGPLVAAPVSLSSPPLLTAPSTDGSPAGAVLKLLVLSGAVFGAIRIKDTGTLAKKFVQRASAAAGDYKTGVEAAGQDWHSRTAASGDNYAAGVQAAIGAKRFEKGVNDAGAQKYTTRAGSLGAQRFPTGVGAAEADWSKGAAPYLDELKSMELPPRRPKGDPGNMARANAVAARLRARKVGA